MLHSNAIYFSSVTSVHGVYLLPTEKKMLHPSMILLPPCPASLTHKNPQRHKIICGIHPIGRRERSIDQSKDVFLEYPVCVISVPVLFLWLLLNDSFLLVFVVLYNRRSILL